MAINVEKLPEGTVTFEDVSKDRYQGIVEKALSRSSSKRQHDPLHGKIVFETADGIDDVVFSDRDLQGEFSLCAGDLVEFNVAVGKCCPVWFLPILYFSSSSHLLVFILLASHFFLIVIVFPRISAQGTYFEFGF